MGTHEITRVGVKTNSQSVDWEAIERDYRAGVLTLRAIASEHGITHGAVTKRANKEGWTRDLAAKIKAKADALVSKQAVSKEVSKARLGYEQEVIDANAQMQADIIIRHRQDVPRVRSVLVQLLEELEGSVGAKSDLDAIGEILAAGDEARMVDVYRRVMGLPGRIDCGKKLADALRTAVSLERDVFGIESARTPGQTLDDFLDAIAKS